MDIEFNKNSDFNKQLVDKLKYRLSNVYLGGGQSRIEKHKKKGKFTARERIELLLDKGSDSVEIGALAAEGMYEEHGGCPSAGVVVVIGYVCGKQCIVVANDATVKAGAWFPMTAKKNLRAQEIAMENRIPIIYLVDSAGVFLPMQEEVFPDKEHFGRIFRNNAQMSAMGIVQIAAIMGSCVAGGAYLPIMSDEALIVEKTGTIFLAGSYLVKAAIGEDIDNETLGGAETHSEISGVTDYKCKDDTECIETIRELIGKIGEGTKTGFNREQPVDPKEDIDRIFGYLPLDRAKPYDVRALIKCMVDDSRLTEYKKTYGKTLVCAYARIDGWSVGIVANQREIVKSGKGEMRMGGVIYSDAADKAARFIMNCNQKKIPLVFLQDVSGFMVGSKAEHGGIIKDGAKMVQAMSNCVVPKFTVIIGNSYGAGNYAMCGKAFDPNLIVSWPTAQMGVMSGASAAKTLLQIKIAAQKSQDKELSSEETEKMKQEIIDQYNEQLSPYYAAARLWVDAIIDPRETRKVISMGIEAANTKGELSTFNLGLLQT